MITEVDTAEVEPAAAPSPPSDRAPSIVAAVLLLAAPILLFWPLRARLFGRADMVDPYLHSAVIEHGRDLVERFGSGDRQVSRAGFTVPGRLTNAVLGDLGGYYIAYRECTTRCPRLVVDA